MELRTKHVSFEADLEGRKASKLEQNNVVKLESFSTPHSTLRGLGGGLLSPDYEYDIFFQNHAQMKVYGPSLAMTDDWEQRITQLGLTKTTHEYAIYQLFSTALGWSAWKAFLPDRFANHKLLITRAIRLLTAATIRPAHAKPPHPTWVPKLRSAAWVRARHWGLCASHWYLCGVAGSCWPLVVVVFLDCLSLKHSKVNTSVQEGRAPEQHSQHGVEGRATKTPDTKGQLEQAKKQAARYRPMHTTRRKTEEPKKT